MKKRTPKTNSSKAATRPRVRENGVKDIKSRTPLCAENVIGALRIVCGHRSHILKSFKACVRILTSSIAASSRIFYYYRTRPGYIRVQFEYSYLRSISPQVLVAFIPCLHRAQLKLGIGRQIRLSPKYIRINRRCDDGRFRWFNLTQLSVEDVEDLQAHVMTPEEVEVFGQKSKRRRYMASQDLVENMMGELGQSLDHLMDLCRSGSSGLSEAAQSHQAVDTQPDVTSDSAPDGIWALRRYRRDMASEQQLRSL